jgi:DNA-binding transcriptional MerR regulator
LLVTYRVEQLAAASGTSVDTIRFYQGRGLLPAPARRGRFALYGPEHLRALRRIRELSRAGFTLEQIGRLRAQEDGGPAPAGGARRGHATRDPLLSALTQEVGGRRYTRSELAAQAGIPEAMLATLEAGGLLQPVLVEGEQRFGEADLGMCRAALAIFGAGFPLPELLALAGEHARNVEAVVDRAIALFEQRVRTRADAAGPAAGELFRELLPQATRLVALHFQHTLVRRALARLQSDGDRAALAAALEQARSGRLEVTWT